MAIIVRIPTPLRPLTGGQAEVSVSGKTVDEVLEALEKKHAGLKARLCDEKGQLRRFINLYLDEEEIRHLQGLGTQVRDGQTLSIIPAVAGGRGSVFQEKMAELKKTQKELSVDEVKKKLGSPSCGILIDVRESEEFRRGHLPGALSLPRGYLELKIEETVPNKDERLILYCGGGTRSLLAAGTLAGMGYKNIISMAGGFRGWCEKGFSTETPVSLSETHKNRYSRHLSIPEVGEEGQAKLLASKVVLIGAGGLGCPAAYYLTAAGVGTLGIVDFDVVDESNLQRQILHTTDRIGLSKIQSAVATLTAFNPGVKIIPFEERLSSKNVERIFKDFDVVVDGSDNFPTRYLVNDACVKLKKPCVHGSVYRFEGQATVFDPSHGGPCYRCLYKEPPPPDMAPSCADAGVLGVLPGIIGLLQAIEVIKIILGVGHPLLGRLLAYDGLEGKFKEFKLHRDPVCAYCAEGKKFPGYVDYEQFCSQ